MHNHNMAITDRIEYDEGLREHMLKVYRILGLGLVVTTLLAWLATTPSIAPLLISGEGVTGLGLAAIFAPLGILLLALFPPIGKHVKVIYWLFVSAQGVGLSIGLQDVAPNVVTMSAAAAATMFGAASLYGYTTSRDLTSFGSFLFMALIGLIAVALLNIFLGSSVLDLVLSCVAILIFTGLTAWDTQAIKSNYLASANEAQLDAMRYSGALGLYLNAINIFIHLVSILNDD